MKARNFIKEIPQHRSFSMNIVNFLRKTFFVEHFWLLLLTGLPQYSKVSWGVCFLISHLLVLSILIKNLYKMLHKQFFTATRQTSFFLAWIDLYHLLSISECFGKAVVFDSDEKHTQNVSQITMNHYIMCQKSFFACLLRLIQCFHFQDMI